jgi:hypothetical protein
MPVTNVHLHSGRFPLQLGRVFLMIAGLCCCALTVFSQAPDGATADEQNSSWTATTDLKSGDLLSTRIPVRITENHRQNGNRRVDERSVQIRGVDGRLAPYQEIETETLQVDSTTVRTTIRTFGRDVNGAKSLIQVTEEERRTLPGGDSNVLRITSNPDVNGKLKTVQHEFVETRAISKDAEETNATVMLPNINGGLAPTVKTHELRQRRADGTTESEKTTLLADGAGKWELSEKRQVITRPEGSNRTSEERVFRRNAEGKLAEISRIVTKAENGSGEKRETTEIRSVDVPGGTRDGSLHLVELTTTTQRTTATGEQITEKKVEQPNPGEPSAGLRVSILVNNKMVPAPSGEQSAATIRTRDANGNFAIVSVDTTRSDRISTIQIQQSPSEPTK